MPSDENEQLPNLDKENPYLRNATNNQTLEEESSDHQWTAKIRTQSGSWY